jgi:hypothetical protein
VTPSSSIQLPSTSRQRKHRSDQASPVWAFSCISVAGIAPHVGSASSSTLPKSYVRSELISELMASVHCQWDLDIAHLNMEVRSPLGSLGPLRLLLRRR